jgi:hypothetical protein
MVFRRIGNSEYINRAINEGAKPNPTRGMKIVNSASDGIVKKTDVIASESSLARGCRRVTTPTTMAMRLAKPNTVTT